MRQTFRPGNRSDAQPHQDHLGKARTRIGSTVQPWDEAGHGNVKEAGGCERKSVGQYTEGPLQAEKCRYASEDRRKSGRHIHDEGPTRRHPGVDEDREVSDAMRDFVRRDSKGRHQTERKAS